MPEERDSGFTALHYAATRADDDPSAAGELLRTITPQLLEATTSLGRTPLHIAAMFGRQRAVRELLTAGASKSATDKNNQTPLSLCACYNVEPIIPQLLLDPSLVNTFDRYSWTPIFWACFRDFDQTYDVLRSAGAKLEFKDGQSKTVLHWAAEKGSVKVLRKMLEADRFMDLEIKDTGGRTAMSWAAEKGQVGALKLLIAHDANKNAQSNDGWTPLFWAAKNGHVEAIRYLLGRRVNTSIIDAKGRRVLEVAHPVARSLFL